MPASVSSFIARAGSQVEGGDRDGLLELWHVLSTVVDPRKARGRRHGLATVLALAVAAVAGGARSLSAIAGWAGDLPVVYWSRFGVHRSVPSAATFARVLARVDPDVLDGVLGTWVAARAGALVTGAPIAVDGKSLRGARRADGSRVHLFAMITHGTAIPLGQVAVSTKGFEIAAFATVLDRVDLHGRIITADALHTQVAHAHYLHRHGAHYVFTVKGNQPRLHQRLVALPWAAVPIGHTATGKAHGRRERRTVQLISHVRPALNYLDLVADRHAQVLATRINYTDLLTNPSPHLTDDLDGDGDVDGLLGGAAGITSAYERAVEADLASMRTELHGDLPAGVLPGQLDLADLTGFTGFTPGPTDNPEDPR